MSTKKIVLPITTRRLVETFAEKLGVSPVQGAFILASLGRTTHGGEATGDYHAYFLSKKGRTTRT